VVSYKLRGAGGAAGVLENPGRVLATANALTAVGIICAAAASRAPRAHDADRAGRFHIVLGIPLLVSAAYLVPRVVGRRWAEPIVAHAAPRLDKLGRAFAPFVPWRDPSTRTTLAAVLTNADTRPWPRGRDGVVSGVLAFADRPVRELMTPAHRSSRFPRVCSRRKPRTCASNRATVDIRVPGSLDEVIA